MGSGGDEATLRQLATGACVDTVRTSGLEPDPTIASRETRRHTPVRSR